MSAALLNSPAFILAEYIIDQGIGSMTNPASNLAWPLYNNFLPDATGVKTDLGSIYDTSGVKDGRLMTGEMIAKFGIQFRIRSSKYEEGYNKAQEVAVALDSVFNGSVTIGVDEFEINNVSRQGPVISLGVEKGTTGRRFFTVNFLITLRRVV
jgi:hypothetical protein